METYLLQFKVGYFLTFNEIQTFSMVAGPSKDHTNYIMETSSQRVLKTSLIYGANSSGKSNFVKGFMYSRMRIIYPSKDHFSYGIDSFRDYAHIDGSGKRTEKPSYFEYILMLNGRMFSYGIEAETLSSTIMSEWLVEIYDDSSEEVVYAIELDGTYSGIDDLKDLFIDYAKGSRQGSFLHYASKLGYDGHYGSILAGLAMWFMFGLKVIPASLDGCLLPVCDSFFSILESELQSLDIPVSLVLEKIPFVKKSRGNIVADSFLERTLSSADQSGHVVNLNSKEFREITLCSNSNDIIYQVTFHHKRGGMTLPFAQESEGTRRVVMLLSFLYSKFEDVSSTVIFDEIESNLHTLICKAIVERFVSGRYACNQFVFTTHETKFMVGDFRLDIFWVVDSSGKETTNESQLYSLEEFKDISRKSLNEDYLDGVYGGTPFIKEI